MLVFRKTWVVLLLFIVAFCFSSQLAAQTLFGAEGADRGRDVYTINPATGAGTLLGDAGAAMTGLAVHPVTGVIYGSTANTRVNSPSPQMIPPGSLVTIDPTTGAATLVGSFGIQGTLADLSFHPITTVLYGWRSGQSGDLYTVDLSTGQATLVGESGLSSLGGNGLAFNSSGVLFFAGSGTQGPLRTVDPATGLTSNVVTLSGFPSDSNINSLAFRGGTLFGVVSGEFELVTIDTTSGVISSIGPAASPSGDGIDGIVFAEAPTPAAVNIPTISEIGFILLIISLVVVARRFRLS